MIAMSRLIRLIARDPMRRMSRPLKRTWPAVGWTRRRIDLPRVDLPHPDSPTRPSVSPCLISRSTPSTARTWPTTRLITPERTGNHVRSPRTSTRGSAGVHPGADPRGGASAKVRAVERDTTLSDPAPRQLVAHRQEFRLLLCAASDGERAARRELAPSREPDHVRRRPVNWFQRLMLVRVESRDRAQQ